MSIRPCRSINLGITMIACGAAAIAVAQHSEFSVRVGAETLAAYSPPPDVETALVTVDGNPGIRLTFSGRGPVSLTVAEVPFDRLDNRRIEFTADASCTALATTACLELYAIVEGRAYYSRALFDEMSGTLPTHRVGTPFLLRPGDHMEAARMGVRFDGPGTVTISNLTLHDQGPLTGWRQPHEWAGLAGALVGVLTTLWCCAALYLSGKGNARGPILQGTLSTGIAGTVAAISGALLLADGASRDIGYPLLLLGAITATNFALLYAILRWRYKLAETRRMRAMDLG